MSIDSSVSSSELLELLDNTNYNVCCFLDYFADLMSLYRDEVKLKLQEQVELKEESTYSITIQPEERLIRIHAI